MKLRHVLCTIVIIKLIVIVILKVFFFPNYIDKHTDKGGEADFVANELIHR